MQPTRIASLLGLCAVLTLSAPHGAYATRCTESTPVDPDSPFAVTLGFWRSSEVEGTGVPTNLEPAVELEFTWTDSQECFAWVRTVAESAGGGTRLNIATAFELDFSQNGVIFTYVQNAGRCCDAMECCDEFETIGTRKEFSNRTLTLDESTGQTGDPLMVAVVDYRESYRVQEYRGVNAIPAVSMQIFPSIHGDSVTNDAEYPPGKGDKVVVGFWEHPDGYQPREGENPCDGEPTMKIAYPLEYGSQKCFGWNHWTKDEDPLHENSAKNFSCSDGVFHYNQWTTMTCEGNLQVGDKGTPKSAAIDKCSRDSPPQIWSQILSGCGKKPPDTEP